MLLVSSLWLAGCATNEAQQKRPLDASIEEARVYVESVRPEKVPFVRYKEPLRYNYLNDQFVLLEGRGGVFLIEFRRICRPLSSGSLGPDMADQRSRRGQLQAKKDTIRGCLIEEIYRLPEAEEQTAESE